MRNGPFAVEMSTTVDPCMSSTTPRTASRRAAMRLGSTNAFASATPTALTASEGQMLVWPGRDRSSCTIAVSSATSTARIRRVRHAFEQYFTSSQLLAHCFRKAMIRPHRAQCLDFTMDHPLGAALPTVNAHANELHPKTDLQTHPVLARWAWNSRHP